MLQLYDRKQNKDMIHCWNPGFPSSLFDAFVHTHCHVCNSHFVLVIYSVLVGEKSSIFGGKKIAESDEEEEDEARNESGATVFSSSWLPGSTSKYVCQNFPLLSLVSCLLQFIMGASFFLCIEISLLKRRRRKRCGKRQKQWMKMLLRT